jgi:DNA-binding NarL/FixJ family response regulator
LTEGAIDKIKERTPANYPTGLDRLMMFAFESMPFVTGINLEALGLANREQAGVLEAQRRKAAMAILAPLFASHREFRKNKGRLYLEFIEKFFPEEKIIRVVGQKAAQYAKFVKMPEIQMHDVVVDESPDSPDFKEQVWAGLQEILPALLKQGVAIPAEVLAYSPLPSEVAEALQKAMQGAQPLPPEVQAKMEELQQQAQKIALENQKLKERNQQLEADQQTEMMKIRAKEMADQRGAAVKIEEAQIEGRIEERIAFLQAGLEKWKTELEQRTEIIVANIQAAASVRAAKEKPRPTKQ